MASRGVRGPERRALPSELESTPGVGAAAFNTRWPRPCRVRQFACGADSDAFRRNDEPRFAADAIRAMARACQRIRSPCPSSIILLLTDNPD